MPYPTIFTTPGVRAFAEAVDAERQQQLAKFGEQHHPDGTGGQRWRDAANHVRGEVDDAARLGNTTWRDVLREEVFEALAEADSERLRTELTQVAAVCAAWIFDLDSRGSNATPPGPGCPAALLPLGTAPAEPCVRRDQHTEHRTAEGALWTDPADEDEGDSSDCYPTQICVFCDRCGVEHHGDYLVSVRSGKAMRLEIAREHLRRNEGWQCGAAGDFCPGCKPGAGSDARAGEGTAR